MSITHGTSPRRHIWTYAVGFTDNGASQFYCPCNRGSSASTPPLVGDNYYCESGTTNPPQNGALYPNDPLWDGMNCKNRESRCCTNRNLPWFSTSLPEPSVDHLELRLLFSHTSGNEGSPHNLIELYIR